MFDTRDLRAAALVAGLGFMGALPEARGALVLEDGPHVLGSYRYDYPDTVDFDDLFVSDESADRPSVTLQAAARATVTSQAAVRPSISGESVE